MLHLKLLEALDDWSSALERQNCIDVVYFDIKSAFDAINHERLLQKLYNSGIQGLLLKWIKSFLFQRSFVVKIGQNFSTNYPIHSVVPQGSVLGPLLFIFYMSDILLNQP